VTQAFADISSLAAQAGESMTFESWIFPDGKHRRRQLFSGVLVWIVREISGVGDECENQQNEDEHRCKHSYEEPLPRGPHQAQLALRLVAVVIDKNEIYRNHRDNSGNNRSADSY
jgi:hypothetical protein